MLGEMQYWALEKKMVGHVQFLGAIQCKHMEKMDIIMGFWAH